MYGKEQEFKSTLLKDFPGGCWEAQCKIDLKEEVRGKMVKGQKYPGIWVLIAEEHFLPLAMLGAYI